MGFNLGQKGVVIGSASLRLDLSIDGSELFELKLGASTQLSGFDERFVFDGS